MRSLRLSWLASAALVVSAAAQNAPRQVTTIVAGGTVVTVDGARNIYTPGAVAIDGTTIVAVGPAADIAATFKAAEQINTAGSIVIPGLINTHGARADGAVSRACR